ncbi:MAG: methylated-DNA--[protein]-cysteine S-methyltransferase [Pseudomonadota bacterium]
MSQGHVTTSLGHVRVTCEDGAVTRVRWGQIPPKIEDQEPDPVLADALSQIEAYFAGELTKFTVPVEVAGSAFQKQVCAAMQDVPFGETCTYGDLAKICEAPAQAIGAACGGNPIPIIIPCHRVLGANNLGGFSGSGGIEDKVWLLRHEGAAGLLI